MVRKALGVLVVALCMAVAVSAPASAGGKELSHKAAAAKLRAANIGWTSSGRCSNRDNPTCTSFSGIKSGTISGVVTFKKSSRCKVTVTGGTETGHASGTYSHWNGYKIDIAETAHPSADADPVPNSPYPVSQQGQADALLRVFRIVEQLMIDRHP